jgi:hypothetical protein
MAVPDSRRLSAALSAGLQFGALLVNGFTASWLMRLAYLPPNHWWQRCAANVSPLAAFLMLVPFAAFALGIALLMAGKIAFYRGWFVAVLILVIAIGVGSVPAGWRLQPGESIRRAGLERIIASAQPGGGSAIHYRTGDKSDKPGQPLRARPLTECRRVAPLETNWVAPSTIVATPVGDCPGWSASTVRSSNASPSIRPPPCWLM